MSGAKKKASHNEKEEQINEQNGLLFDIFNI